MKNKETFSILSRLKSFIYAFSGIKTLLQTEHNSWIQITAGTIAIICGFILNINHYEWCLIVFAIAIVLIAEIFNTAIEQLTDMVAPEYNEQAKKVKDLAAGGVLIASITAGIIGLLVFILH